MCKPEDVPKFPSYWLPNTGNFPLNSKEGARKIFQQLLKGKPRQARIVAIALKGITFDPASGTNLPPRGTDTDLFKLFDEEAKKSNQKPEVIAWIEGVFKDGTKSALFSDPNNKDVIIKIDSSGAKILNPLKPMVQYQLIKIVQNLANRSDVNAIEFDDHFCIPKDYQKAVLGKSKDYRVTEVDRKFLKDSMTSFLRKIKQAAGSKPIYISINGNKDKAVESSQDIEQWIKEGLVKKVNVQVYRSNLKDFKTDTDNGVNWAKSIKLPELSIGFINNPNNKQLSLDVLKKQAKYLKDLAEQNKDILLSGVGFDFDYFYKRCQNLPRDPKTGNLVYTGTCFSPDDLALDGSICGKRAALLRPGGIDLLDYIT